LRGFQGGEVARIAQKSHFTLDSIADGIEPRHDAIWVPLDEFTADKFGETLVSDVGAHGIVEYKKGHASFAEVRAR
jgi:hypothetical protein